MEKYLLNLLQVLLIFHYINVILLNITFEYSGIEHPIYFLKKMQIICFFCGKTA